MAGKELVVNPELSERGVENFTDLMEKAWKRGDELAFVWYYNHLYPEADNAPAAPKKRAPRKAAAKAPAKSA